MNSIKEYEQDSTDKLINLIITKNDEIIFLKNRVKLLLEILHKEKLQSQQPTIFSTNLNNLESNMQEIKHSLVSLEYNHSKYQQLWKTFSESILKEIGTIYAAQAKAFASYSFLMFNSG